MDFYYYHHPQIRALVQQLEHVSNAFVQTNASDLSSETTFIKVAFDFVRDEIIYKTPLDWTKTTLETLESKSGNCFNKAALLCSILKTKGLQARFCVPVMPLEGYCHRMAPDHIWNQFPTRMSPHALVQVYSNQSKRWITLDPTIDSSLAEGMRRYGNPDHCFSFNGKNDAVCSLFWNFNHTTHDDIDHVLTKKPSYDKGLVELLDASNAFLRRFGPKFSNPTQLEKFLKYHLLNDCPAIIQSKTNFLPPNYPKPVRRYCDSNHPQIRALAANLRNKAPIDADFAKSAFYWVRDRIRYNLQADWSVPVEHTLAVREGMCSTKACLLVSILRAGGLQAGFYVQRQDAKECFLAPDWISSHYSRHSFHVLAAVKLHGKWLKLDVYGDRFVGESLDTYFAKVSGPSPVRYLVEFDGYNDACSNPHVEMKFVENIDHFMSKKSRIPKAVIQCQNICFELERKFCPMFDSSEEAIQVMERHLMRFHPDLVANVMGPKDTPATSQVNYSLSNLALLNQRHRSKL